MTEVGNNKPISTFKKYYQNPEFKEKHLTYIKEKVSCPDCGEMTARANLTRHKKTLKHQKLTGKKKKETDTQELEKIVDILKQVTNALNALQKTVPKNEGI